MPQQRVPYIDFLKGVCIIMVMMYHISHNAFNDLVPGSTNAVMALLMPMFFFISGINFKTYDGLADFLRRKVNSILVPLLFFIVFALVVRLAEWAVRWLLGATPVSVSLSMLYEPFIQRYWPFTAQLWFLFGLFWVNIIYYVLQRWLPRWAIVLTIIALALVGCWMGQQRIYLPWMIDTALVSLPFFLAGRCASLWGCVQPSRHDRWGIVVLLLAIVPVYLWAGELSVHFMILPPFWQFYPISLLAVVALFWAAKNLPHIPVLCDIGRYSLIIFGTHPVLMYPIRFACEHYGLQPGNALTLTVLVLLLCVEIPVVWLLKRYFPRFTALKPLFKPGWRL